MIYVVIPENKLAQSNKWITDRFLNVGDSFVVNKQQTVAPFKKYCVTSFIDDGSAYTETIKAHFGYTDYVTGYYNPRGIPKEHKREIPSTEPGMGKIDLCDFIAGLIDIEGPE